MNKLLLFLAIFISSLQVPAQTVYHPMLDSINHWDFGFEGVGISPESPCYYPFSTYWSNQQMTADSDTLINGFDYKIIYSEAQCFFGLIREDTSTRKIYFIDNLFSPEILLYDFNMQIGDTIALHFDHSGFSSYWQDGTYRLDSIDSVSTLAGYRQRFYLNCMCANSNTLIWMEGVGNLENPVYPYAINDYGFWYYNYYCPEFPHNKGGDFVTCFSHEQRVYFDSCAYNASLTGGGFTIIDSCNFFYFMSSVADLDFGGRIFIQPNPFHQQTEIVIEDGNSSSYNFEMFDVTGRRVTQERFNQSHLIVSRQNLSDGLYFFRLTDEKGSKSNGKLIIE